MTTQSNNLPISRLISVGVSLTPPAAQAQSLNTMLLLGTSEVIDVTERMRIYESLAAVAADFGTTAEEYLAAVLWFEQAPQPTSLYIGRWADTDTSGELIGGGVSTANQLIGAWTPITTPGFFVYLDGIPHKIAPASFAAQTNLNGIASLIQTALAAALASTTCVWDADFQRFVIESGTTGDGSSVSFLTAPTATGAVTFSGQPANLDTLTFNGTVVTFVTGTPTGNQVQIGASTAATILALLAFLQASADTQLVKFTYVADATKLYTTAAATGAGGNALTLAKSGANLAVSGATLAGGTGTDISDMLAGLSTSSGAYVADGIDAETAIDAVTLFDTNYGQLWYGLSVLSSDDDDSVAIAAFIEGSGNKHLFGVSTQEAGVLSPVSTTDIAYILSQLGYNRTVVQYSSTSAYSVLSLFGRLLTVNYGGNNTTIDLMYKQEPGIVAESLNATQIAAAEAKNANVFVNYNNDTAIIDKGNSASGNPVDVITGTDWLALTIQTALYNLLYTSPTKIPQTDAGNHLLVVTAEAVCSQGVTNGLLAPGTWNATGFGTLAQGDFLAKGFYVFAASIATQSQSDRTARKSVPIQIAAKLAGAIRTIAVLITVNQ